MKKIIQWFRPSKSLPKITKIYRDTREPSYFMVDWMLHDRCTYDCSYCPPANKSGTDTRLNLETLDLFCNNLEEYVRSIDPDFKIKVLFTGGEPTVWKDFGELVSRLSARGWLLLVNSNGSRSERWWEEHSSKFASIILSYHTEFVDDEEFLRKLRICEKTTHTAVNIMLNPEPKYFKKALATSERIKKETSHVSVNYYKIQHNFGLQDIDVPQYTEDQLKKIETLVDYHPKLLNFYTIILYNYYVKLDNGSTDKLNALELLKTKQVNFKDWDCYAGMESIFIDASGDILRGACRAEGNFGSIYSPNDINWPTVPVKCPYEWCGCVTDLLNSKTSP